MREFSRSRRVGEQIQRELANIISQEINDPDLGMLTISGIDLSPDLKSARVYVSILGGKLDIKDTIEYLNAEAGGKLRYSLSQRLKLRTIPRLLFVYDSSIEYGNRLSALIDSVK